MKTIIAIMLIFILSYQFVCTPKSLICVSVYSCPYAGVNYVWYYWESNQDKEKKVNVVGTVYGAGSYNYYVYRHSTLLLYGIMEKSRDLRKIRIQPNILYQLVIQSRECNENIESNDNGKICLVESEQD